MVKLSQLISELSKAGIYLFMLTILVYIGDAVEADVPVFIIVGMLLLIIIYLFSKLTSLSK